jgi:hypothetical protein
VREVVTLLRERDRRVERHKARKTVAKLIDLSPR